MPTNNLDKIMKESGSRVNFHSENFGEILGKYGSGFAATGQTNMRAELERYLRGIPGVSYRINTGKSLVAYGQPLATEEEIEKHRGPYKIADLEYSSLIDLFTRDGSLSPDLVNQMKSDFGIDFQNGNLGVIVNLSQPANWHIQTGEAEPIIRDREQTYIGKGFLGIKRKKTRTVQIISGLKRVDINNEENTAYSNELINTENEEPLYVNQVGIFMPARGRTYGASRGRFLFFQLYTPESTDRMIQDAGGISEQKNLLLDVFAKNFPDVYQESQARLAVVNTSLEQLPAFLYKPPNTKQLSKI